MITDEQAKALQEFFKMGSTAIEQVGNAGSYLGKIAFDPLHELSGIATDEVRLRRRVRFAMRYMEARKELRLRGIEPNQFLPLPDRLAVPLIEAASLADDETLQGLWAKLIANAMDPGQADRIHPAYIEIIKQLKPEEALVLSKIPTEKSPLPFMITAETPLDYLNNNHYDLLIAQFANTFKKNGIQGLEKWKLCVDNLVRLQLFTYTTFPCKPVSHDEECGVIPVTIGTTLELTTLGKGFIDACVK